ncbi:hypothetical protein [Parendozoicomonas haliclonae]|uniref:Uncharacterized protein n=1 Tax=Parendozoicomonas haliclonae TaxID=1960125 RepID=A0A1X7AEL9_9GAMM|nr:hypothetical protein [Parendozoicomonas haliclonae]SMA34909.1 hypothetical protein EHSB41UT_00468 [Parendozoicomonas haliclonae]
MFAFQNLALSNPILRLNGKLWFRQHCYRLLWRMLSRKEMRLWKCLLCAVFAGLIFSASVLANKGDSNVQVLELPTGSVFYTSLVAELKTNGGIAGTSQNSIVATLSFFRIQAIKDAVLPILYDPDKKQYAILTTVVDTRWIDVKDDITKHYSKDELTRLNEVKSYISQVDGSRLYGMFQESKDKTRTAGVMSLKSSTSKNPVSPELKLLPTPDNGKGESTILRASRGDNGKRLFGLYWESLGSVSDRQDNSSEGKVSLNYVFWEQGSNGQYQAAEVVKFPDLLEQGVESDLYQFRMASASYDLSTVALNKVSTGQAMGEKYSCQPVLVYKPDAESKPVVEVVAEHGFSQIVALSGDGSGALVVDTSGTVFFKHLQDSTVSKTEVMPNSAEELGLGWAAHDATSSGYDSPFDAQHWPASQTSPVFGGSILGAIRGSSFSLQGTAGSKVSYQPTQDFYVPDNLLMSQPGNGVDPAGLPGLVDFGQLASAESVSLGASGGRQLSFVQSAFDANDDQIFYIINVEYPETLTLPLTKFKPASDQRPPPYYEQGNTYRAPYQYSHMSSDREPLLEPHGKSPRDNPVQPVVAGLVRRNETVRPGLLQSLLSCWKR